MNKPVIFLDRDGVINRDHGYVHTVEQFEFVPGVLDAARKLCQLGYQLVVVTNQSGIARGYYSEKQFKKLTEWMSEQFQLAGAPLTKVYYCPHHPDGTVPDYSITCRCRKPAPGMFEHAVDELNVTFSKSIMVGDKADDMRAARSAGVKLCVLVKTGKSLSSDALALADVVLDSLAQLPAYLDK